MSVSQTPIRVRYAETDQMGIVYYANFFIWFEVGRVELLRQLGFHYKQMEIEDDCHFPVVEASCATNLLRITTTSCCSRPAFSRCAVRYSIRLSPDASAE